jgi:outer membrane autotransporter protein
MNDLQETRAAGADLAIAGWSARSLRTRAGFAAGRDGAGFAPRLEVFWLHETSGDRSIPTAFAGGGTPYAAPGRPAEKNLVQASVGFDWQLGKRAVFHATAGGAWGGHSRLDADLSAGFRWTF